MSFCCFRFLFHMFSASSALIYLIAPRIPPDRKGESGGRVGGRGRSNVCTSTIATGDPCQLGSVFPDASAVYLRYWCVVSGCDGPSLMFVAHVTCFGFRWNMVPPYGCCISCISAKTMRFVHKIYAHDIEKVLVQMGSVLPRICSV